ncbi:MAG: penicillin acylase family protein, partial [Candidatus Solibacter sp.]
LARAKDWSEFRAAMDRYKVPSENLVYADTKGNIGWQVGGLTPIRDGFTGLLPVPGDEGRYEWKGYRKSTELPFEFNPARHYIATANHNILPPGYTIPLGYDGWATPYRIDRIREMLGRGGKFDLADFVRMQQDVTSLRARQFQQTIAVWTPAANVRGARYAEEVKQWDAAVRADSRAALVYEVWSAELPAGDITRAQLEKSLAAALDRIEAQFGKDPAGWQWGKLHQLTLAHPSGNGAWQLGPVARPGDANTVNATSGDNFRQTNGTSWREVLDVGDWDRSLMTNVPGESGDPTSKHYSDLLEDWAAGRYHPMPFTRQAVEAAMEERIVLRP